MVGIRRKFWFTGMLFHYLPLVFRSWRKLEARLATWRIWKVNFVPTTWRVRKVESMADFVIESMCCPAPRL